MAPKVVKELRHMNNEGRLREPGFFSLEERMEHNRSLSYEVVTSNNFP